jgi:hypothetical protein
MKIQTAVTVCQFVGTGVGSVRISGHQQNPSLTEVSQNQDTLLVVGCQKF